MSYGDYRKMLKQLDTKPEKKSKYLKHNAPKERSCGINRKKCRRCGRIRGHVDKYGLNLCRQCFRDTAQSLGFKKYR